MYENANTPALAEDMTWNLIGIGAFITRSNIDLVN